MLLDIYPHNSLDDVMSQITEREVLKCLTYLGLEPQVAKGLLSTKQLRYGIPYLTILNFVVTLALPLFKSLLYFKFDI